MSWFSKSAAVELEPDQDADPVAERLAQIEFELPLATSARDQLRREVRELRQRQADPRVSILPVGLIVTVDALHVNCPHSALEKAQRHADARVDNLLAERATLLMQSGRIR